MVGGKEDAAEAREWLQRAKISRLRPGNTDKMIEDGVVDGSGQFLHQMIAPEE